MISKSMTSGSAVAWLAIWAAASVCFAAAAQDGDAADAQASDLHVHLRGSLDNCRIRFERDKQGHVAFMGGSITEMNGYRPMVMTLLTKRFPDASFTFTDAGIASTCSTTGAMRVEADVLSKGPVDLFFVEFAVNDDQDAGHARRECVRGLEGIVRHLRRHNPNADIVVAHFVNPGMLATIQAGKTPLTIAAHDAVAEHYRVSVIDLAHEVAGQIAAGTLTWQKFGGTHPAAYGNAICARMIERLFDRAWAKPLADDAKPTPHAAPEPIDAGNYAHGRFIDPKRAAVKNGWTLHVPDWAALPGAKRDRFTTLPMLCATEAGATLTLNFEGGAVGAYVSAGPDAGVVETSVDGGPFKAADLYHRFSKGLHYPRTVMFATDLKPGPHVLTLRVAAETKSDGHAARIMQFVAN